MKSAKNLNDILEMAEFSNHVAQEDNYFGVNMTDSIFEHTIGPSKHENNRQIHSYFPINSSMVSDVEEGIEQIVTTSEASKLLAEEESSKKRVKKAIQKLKSTKGAKLAPKRPSSAY